MRHLKTPSYGPLSLALALLASLLFHVPAYVSLDALAKSLDFTREPAQVSEVTIDIEIGDDAEDEAEPEPSDLAEPEDDRGLDSSEDPPPQRRQRRARIDDRPAPEPDPVEEDEAEVEVVEVRPPRPDPMNRQAIQQRSRDPNVEPPPDSRFIAEENQRVEEEMQARLRSYTQDSAELSAGETSESQEQELGNDDLQEVADARDMEGSDRRDPTEQEVEAERPEEASEVEPPAVAARGDTGRTGAGREDGRDTSAEGVGGDDGGATQAGGGERVVEIHDGYGTILVRLPPEGQGDGTAGGQLRAGTGQGDVGSGEQAGRRDRGRAGERGRGRGFRQRGPDLRVSWTDFEETFTEEQLAQERETWIRERRSRMRGSNRQENWRRFRAAIENFVPNVRPGNQTALNAAASPFANYIAAVHRRIHRQFADRFIQSLPAGGLSPFSDRTLHTKLEIIMNRDGSVHRIGVVRPSGFLPFDHGAFSAVMRGQPYPEAPSAILSGDGRVYLHWGFYRNERQCGTFNAEPFILPNPPGSTRPSAGPFRDELSNDTLVPDDARPSWGTEDEEREPDGDSGGGDDDGGDDGDDGPGDGTDGDRDGDSERRERSPPPPSPHGSALG